MTALYLDSPSGVNWSALSPSCLSFCRWLYRWYHQTGDVSPSTDYLAYKQGKCRRQVYRWLAVLESVGAIRRDAAGTHDREIIPLAEPPKTAKNRLRRSPNVTQNVTQNVTRSSCIDAARRYATTDAEVVVASAAIGGESEGFPQSQSAGPDNVLQAAPATERLEQSKSENPPRCLSGEKLAEKLVAVGVAAPVASELASAFPDEAATQLDALPYRHSNDPAALLVAAIRKQYPLPSKFVALRNSQKNAALKAHNAALRAELAKREESIRLSAKKRFSGLSEQVRADLLDRASAALRSELPAVYKMMQNRHPDTRSAWLTSRAISLMEGGQ